MARNEEGEFELMLGNKQLLSVFFLMVLLLCLCFVGGYLLGRSAAPVLNATNDAPPEETSFPPPEASNAKPEPREETPAASPEPTPSSPPPPVRTAPQVAEKAPAAPTKSAPPPVQQAAKQAPPSSQPIPGRIYLQLSATEKDKADVMVDLLRGKNFAGLAAAVPERPGLYRVLVGPLAETALDDTKKQLNAGGFPGDQAIRRVF